jgi:hypothetical protein
MDAQPTPILTRDDVKGMLQLALRETGGDMARAPAEVAAYAAERAAHLATAAGQPGFAEAVVAERDNVVLYAAVHAAHAADRLDARLRGVVQVVLTTWARALVPPVA